MPFGCSVPNCNTAEKRGVKRRLFSFPEDEKLRLLWESRCRRGGWKSNKNSRLCELHFESSQYIREYPSKRLKKDAVPTIFEEFKNPPKKEVKSSGEKTSAFVEHCYAALDATHMVSVLKERVIQLEKERDALLLQLTGVKPPNVERAVQTQPLLKHEKAVSTEDEKIVSQVKEEPCPFNERVANSENHIIVVRVKQEPCTFDESYVEETSILPTMDDEDSGNELDAPVLSSAVLKHETG